MKKELTKLVIGVIILLLVAWLGGCQSYKGKCERYENGYLVERREFAVRIWLTKAFRKDALFKLEDFGTIKIESSELTPEEINKILKEAVPFLLDAIPLFMSEPDVEVHDSGKPAVPNGKFAGVLQ